jgi:hypothetical protein
MDGFKRSVDTSSKRARDPRQRGAHSREDRNEVIGLRQTKISRGSSSRQGFAGTKIVKPMLAHSIIAQRACTRIASSPPRNGGAPASVLGDGASKSRTHPGAKRKCVITRFDPRPGILQPDFQATRLNRLNGWNFVTFTCRPQTLYL